MTTSTIQTNRFDRSAHSSVDAPIAIRISAPPMVGVPDLVRCVCGPSVRTAWPIFIAVRRRISAGPNIRPISSAVAVASAARSVM